MILINSRKLLTIYVFRTRKAKRHHDIVHRGDY